MTTRSSDRFSRRLFPTFVLGVALATTGCKDDKPKGDEGGKATADAKKGSGAKEGDEGENGKVAEDAVNTAADTISAAPAMARGGVLGHVMFPDPSSLLGKVKRQAAPKSTAPFLDPETLKGLASMGLGSRSEVANSVELDKPFACVLVDSKKVKYALACTLGYLGGAEALVTDLGAEGKQEDAAGTKGHFQIEGQDLYIDDLEKAVVVANDVDALTQAKPYLKDNILARADKNLSDIEAVGYVSALMTRYEKELEPWLGSVGEPPLPSTENAVEQAIAAWVMGSNRDRVARFKDMEQFTVGLGLDDKGFTARWAMFAKKGTELEKELGSISAGPIDLDFVGKMPGAIGMLAAHRFDGKIGENKALKELREVFVGEYAKELGKDEATINAAIDAFLKAETELYGDDVAVGLMHLPGTLSAAVLEAPLEGGKSGRAQWKTWSEGFKSEDILGAKGSKYASWSFKADAAKIGSTPIDRWTLKLTKAALADFEKDDPAAFKKLKAKWKSFSFTIDRAEVDGRVIFVFAPTQSEKFMQVAIDAAGGKDALADNAGFKVVSTRNPKVSALYAMDGKRTADALRELLPKAEAAEIPAGFGTDLSDAFFVNSYGKAGSQTGEVALSQALIDQIRAQFD